MARFSALSFILLLSFARPATAEISGTDLATAKPLKVEAGKKGTVVVFMSAKCPCSNQHVPVLTKLAEEFKDFSFVAVHSNTDETAAEAKAYFAAAHLPFPVLQDEKARIADEYKAFKTPHAYVLGADGKVVYRGGVTSSASAAHTDKQYLRNALADLTEGKAVQQADTRTLGCVIAR